jgi:hypothetical protein
MMLFAIKDGLAYELAPCSDDTFQAIDEDIMQL